MTSLGDKAARPFGIYVHWPFCKAKCPYCDFNSHVARVPVDQMAFAAAIIRELGWFRGLTGPREVESIFFGGGTPSLMAPETVALIVNAIAGLWPVAAQAEVSLEANPTSSEAEKFRGLRAAGVTRLSIGVQALDDHALRQLGRQHDRREALSAIAMARAAFERVSFDMIYARPRQTMESWALELDEALALGPDHLSLYQLTIEPETPFHALHASGKLILPDDDSARALYDLTGEMCLARGLAAYEVSNYATPGAECRHNLIYWLSGDYAGAGPGAHGRLGDGHHRHAFATERDPGRWRDLVARDGHGLVAQDRLGPAETADEVLLMGLRLEQGLDLGRLADLSGHGLDAAVVDTLVGEGMLLRPGPARIAVSARGRPVLNAVIAELASGLSPLERTAPATSAG